jgi:hypothetical protein
VAALAAVPYTTDCGDGGGGGGDDDSGGCARVRAGDNGLPIVYHPAFSKPVMPEGHRFPMKIFRNIYQQLIRDGVAVPGRAHTTRVGSFVSEATTQVM